MEISAGNNLEIPYLILSTHRDTITLTHATNITLYKPEMMPLALQQLRQVQLIGLHLPIEKHLTWRGAAADVYCMTGSSLLRLTAANFSH